MKKLILLLLLMPLMLNAQNFRALDQSPMDQAKFPTSNRVTDKVAIITYSRPQLKNRSFDDIVPKDKVWRTGANEATELRLFNDIEINNTTIVAGTYTLFTIPESEEITFIINKATNIWGAYRYNSENDVLRFKVPISKAEESFVNLEMSMLCIVPLTKTLILSLISDVILFGVPFCLPPVLYPFISILFYFRHSEGCL